jgi:hypothetical protein
VDTDPGNEGVRHEGDTMNIDLRVERNGTLCFATPDQGTVATLNHRQLRILHTLAQVHQQPSLQHLVLREHVGYVLTTKRVLARMQARTTIPPYHWLPDLLPDVEHLLTLDLIAAPPRQQGIGQMPTWPYTPAHLTQQGKRLVEWLTQRWNGWAAYTQRFPL